MSKKENNKIEKNNKTKEEKVVSNKEENIEESKGLLKTAYILVILGLVIIVLLIYLITYLVKKPVSDSVKFSEEYTELTEDNVFVYKDSEEIIKILEHGTGVVLLGFPECPWCQRYVVYLNEVAKDIGIEKIYYYNILEDRKNNTDTYKKIVSLIGDYLQYDEEGNKKIYVPAVIGVNKGKIVGFDDETSYDTKGFETPQEYWNEESINNLKNKLNDIITKSNDNICTSCNS